MFVCVLACMHVFYFALSFFVICTIFLVIECVIKLKKEIGKRKKMNAGRPCIYDFYLVL